MAPKTFLHNGWLCPKSMKEYVKEIVAVKKDYQTLQSIFLHDFYIK